MTQKPSKVPGPDHPITISVNPNRVVVKLLGVTIATTVDALTLREADYPAVHYIPRRDVDMMALSRSSTATHCPYKGEASYFTISKGGAQSIDAAWSYEDPYEAVASIKDHLAFYPNRIDGIEELPQR